METDVFISHCTADREQAEAIREACEAQGLTCWIAPRNIVAGTAWADAIVAGIAGAKLLLLVHSEAANRSPMVRREIDAAAASHKIIVPVRIDTALPQQGMQFYLSSTHWFDAPPPFASHLPRLVETINGLLAPVAAVSPDRTVFAPARFPEFGGQPAIAVLPFRIYAADDDPFADGLTEDIIAALSRWRNFPVIARASVFAFKDKTADLKFVGEQLGARYVADGTVRRRGARMRATIQLGDVTTKENLLAEHYDYDAEDVFEVQDEIVCTIVGAIEPELLRHERERFARTPMQNATAYELLQRGQWHHYRYTPADSQQARAFFRNALAIEPNYARAAAALSITLTYATQARWESDQKAANEEARAMARHAVQADPRDPQAHLALGVALYHAGMTEHAVQELQASIRLNPSNAAAHANLAFAYNYLNRPAEALAAVELAFRLSPHDPRRFVWLPALAASHYLAGRYAAALRVGHEALAANASYLPVARYVVAALGQLGRSEAAKSVMPLLYKLDGNLAASEAHLRQYYVAPAIAHILDGLCKAGFA